MAAAPVTPIIGASHAPSDPAGKILSLWRDHSGDTFAVTPIGYVPPGRVYGQSRQITLKGKNYWLWEYSTIPDSALQVLLTAAGIVGGAGAIAGGLEAGVTAAGSALGLGAADASGEAAAGASAGEAAASGVAGGGAAGAAGKAASVASKAASKAVSTAKSLAPDALLAALGGALLSTGLWKGVGMVIAGAALILLSTRAALGGGGIV